MHNLLPWIVFWVRIAVFAANVILPCYWLRCVENQNEPDTHKSEQYAAQTDWRR